MASIPGTIGLAGAIAPFDDTDLYPTHYSLFGKGGLKSVATLAIRDALPTNRLEDGTACYVQETGLIYIYKSGSWSYLFSGITQNIPFSITNQSIAANGSFSANIASIPINSYIEKISLFPPVSTATLTTLELGETGNTTKYLPATALFGATVENNLVAPYNNRNTVNNVQVIIRNPTNAAISISISFITSYFFI